MLLRLHQCADENLPLCSKLSDLTRTGGFCLKYDFIVDSEPSIACHKCFTCGLLMKDYQIRAWIQQYIDINTQYCQMH